MKRIESHRLFFHFCISLAFLGGTVWAQESPPSAGEQEPSESIDQAAEPGEEASSASQPVAAPDESPSFEDTIASVEETITSVRGQLEEISEEESALRDFLQSRLARLEALKNLYERQRTAANRAQELRQAIAQQRQAIDEFSEESIEEEPPYSIFYLDAVFSERDAVRRELETDERAIANSETAVTRARAALENAVTARRRAREALDANTDPVQTEQLTRALQLSILDERLAEERLAAAEALIEQAKLERDSSRAQMDFALVKAEFAEERTIFTEEELNTRLAELDERGEALDASLETLRGQLVDAENRYYDAQQQGLSPETIATREAGVTTLQRAVEYAELNRSLLSRQKELWETRRNLFLGGEPARFDDWLADAQAVQSEMESARATVEARLTDLRNKQLDIEKRLLSSDIADETKAVLEQQLELLRDRESHARDYLASLISTEQLAQRIRQRLNERLNVMSWEDRWEQFKSRFNKVWTRDVLVIPGAETGEEDWLELGDIIWVGVVFLIVVVAGSAFRRTARRLLKRYIKTHSVEERETLSRDILIVLMNDTKGWIVFLLAAFIAAGTLDLSERPEKFVWGGLYAVLLAQFGIYATSVFQKGVERTRRRWAAEDPSSVSGLGLLSFFGRMIIWVVIVLWAIHLMGRDITAFVAGLGIGGVAIAFALQNILSDIFNSVAIILDKPFVVGDFVKVGTELGTIENIGIKTTRIRALSGEQLVVNNTDLLGSRIQNYKRMEERRVVFHLGVIYGTPKEKLELIPEICRNAVESQDLTRFDRAHFFQYGNFSLNFEIVYYVLSPDYLVYMDRHEAINLHIYSRFEEEGIEFAYPTQEIILQRKPSGTEEA